MRMDVTSYLLNRNFKLKLNSILKKMFLCVFVTSLSTSSIYAKDYSFLEVTEVNNAQQIIIKGKVIDKNGEPLPSASVLVKGEKTGVSTDFDGNYEIKLTSKKNIILVFSYLGYITKEVAIGSQSIVNVTLQEDAVGLNEIVIVGYGTQKKSHLIGAITKIGGDDISQIPVSSVDEALRGQVAGLQIRNTTGEVGEAQEISIRGISSINANNSPLVVIDGIPVPDLDISAVDSNDIQSVEILKDAASTAIYGSRGATGVILITTKSGKAGEKTNFSLNMQSGFKSPIYRYNVFSQFKSNETKLERSQMEWETAFLELGLEPNLRFDANNNPLPNPSGVLYPTMESYLSGSSIERMKTMVALESGAHDWIEDLTRNVTSFNKYSLTARGGSDTSNFYISGSYQNNEGLMKDNTYERLNFMLKLNTKLSDKLNLGVNVSPQFINSEKSTANFNLGLPYDNFMPIYHNDFTSFLTRNTYKPGEYTRSSHFGNGTPILSWDQYYAWKRGELTTIPNDVSVARLSSSSATNPIARQNERNNTNNEFRIISSLNFNWEINEKLKFTSTYSYYFTKKSNNDTETEKYNRYANRKATKYERTIGKFINENTLNYTNNFGDHGLSLLGGITEEITNYSFARIEGSNIPLGSPLTLNNATVISQDASDTFANKEKEVLLSGLFRVNYDYKDRYLFSASVRADGSSIFSQGNRWGYFPSISAGWRLNKEPFMKSLYWLSNLKFRLSYGQSGNNNIARYSYLDRLVARNYTDAPGSITAGLGLENITKGNPEITWEKTNQFNYGLDIGLFKNRIGLTAEYYFTLTDDLLLQKTLPLSTGFENVWENVGKIKNEGLEVQLNATNINTKDFKWKMNLNYAQNRNKLIDFGGQYQMYSYGRRLNEYLMQVGLSPSNMYGWKTNGIYKNLEDLNNYPHGDVDIVGSLKRVDVNGDGEITEADKTIIGNPVPKFNWGFGHEFKYKDFDLSILFEGSHDFDIMNSDYYQYTMRDNISDHFDGAYLDEFHGNKPIVQGGVKWEYTDHIIYDGSYVSLRNVSFGYSLSKAYLKDSGLSKFRMYVTGVNLLHHIYGNYSGINPEYKDSSFNTALTGGEQSYTLPLERSFVFGVNINF